MIAKVLAVALRGLVATVALLLLMLALAWASVLWLIVPRIDNFRPQLMAWASHALDAQVTVERLSGRSSAWAPTILLHGLTITDAAGRPGLEVPQARVDVSLASMLRGRTRAVALDAPQIWVRRDAGGTLAVAGVALTSDADDAGAGLQRLLAQPRIGMHAGSLQWVDAVHDGQWTLDAVDLELQRRGRRHALHLDAGAAQDGASTLVLDAALKSPVWPGARGDWRAWDGQLQLDGQRLPLPQLAEVLASQGRWDFQVASGQATIQLTGAVRSGQLEQAQADFTITEFTGRLGADLPPLQLSSLATSAQWLRQGDEAHLTVDDIQMVMADGSELVGASASLRYPLPAATSATVRTRFRNVDLQALAGFGQHVPLPATVQQAVHQLQPAGWLDRLDAQWQGPLRTPREWQARGELHDLHVAAQPATTDDGAAANGKTAIGWPGASGVDVVFEARATGGRATLAMADGSLTFPGVFEEPVVPVAELQAETNWQVAGDEIRVNVDKLDLINADAEGRFTGYWRTGDGERLPGFLDLQGRLDRGDGARVHRYLPLVLPADARHYVRDAIVQGRISDVNVKVHGPLHEVPFNLPHEDGTFFIAGRVDDGVMVYVPPRFQDAGEPPWPVLTQLGGQLEFESAAMRVRAASARVQDHADWDFADIEADIADFDEARVTVKASGEGKLATALAMVRGSPLAALTEHALDQARASGRAQLQLALDLPLEDLSQATTRGSVQLRDNTITLRAGTPTLEAVQGTISFTETGFDVAGVSARALGGPVLLNGGLDQAQSGQNPERARITAHGTATAAGLQHMATAPEQAAWAAWASAVHGAADYELSLDLTADGIQAAALDSQLQGLALMLPAPFEKPAADRWPLRLRWRRHGSDGSMATDQLELRLADQLALQWARQPRPHGALALGAAARQPLPPADQGFVLVAEFDTLDLDAWAPFMHLPAPASGAPDQATDWLPDQWRVKLRRLRAAGRELDDLTASGQRQGMRWQGQVASPDLAGHVAYEGGAPGQMGHLVARLSRLKLHAPEEAAAPDVEPARDLPSMDLRADRFFWNELDLGQLDLRASQTDGSSEREWRIDELLLSAPEARLRATGRRTAVPNTDPRTDFEFQLTVDDAGALLARLGQPDVMAGGVGSVAGELAWPGSPLDFEFAGMTADLRLNLTHGRFVKMEPGAGKLFGILSLQALPRRLMLDFSDVFRSGFAFDRMQANAQLDRGVISTNDLEVTGVSALVAMEGQADLQNKTQDLHVYVRPRLDAGAAALAATAINPALGAAAFVAQLALRDSLGRAAARNFHIKGSWSDPQVDVLEPLPQKEEPQPHENTMPAAGENSP